jgi:hypothetical protein
MTLRLGYQSESVHPGNQGCPGHAQSGGRTAPPTHDPIRLTKRLDDVRPLYIRQSPYGGR